MASESTEALPPISRELLEQIKRLESQRGAIDDRMIDYSLPEGTAAWYMEKYPGFSEEQCRVFELYSSGMRAKEFKQRMKRDRRKNKQTTNFFQTVIESIMAIITVEKQSGIDLSPPVFKCDKPIHDQIQEPLPRTAFFMAVIGSAGSGKTSLLINLLTSKQAYKKTFHNVFCVIPSHSVASLKLNIFKKHDKMFDELTYSTLDSILDRSKDDAEEGYNSLIVIDDRPGLRLDVTALLSLSL
jgi:hypothetical protein